ncbi:putative Oligoendopeptidase F like protein [Blattamonas nauphoetae]|uniref:Oligoendopeptidase F like protein n=1 Tax=Blattamonas nauphoetae TaxID=2049346 RepID=A0ABQ9Y1S5_9EUKA|nr:putative Oligoendopeptidase F like protein [Blattamonas nauphoetae]
MSGSSSTPHEIPKREDIDPKYKWKTYSIFPSDDAWSQELKTLDSCVEEICALKGKFSENVSSVIQTFQLNDNLLLKIHKLSTFAEIRHIENLDDSHTIGMTNLISSKCAEISSKTSWINPELLALPQATLDSYRAHEDMKPWIRTFDEIVRYKPHTLSTKEESLLAAASSALESSAETYSLLTNADMKYPKIEDEKGTTVALSDGNYLGFLQSKQQSVRKAAWEAMYDTHIKLKNTLSSCLYGNVKNEVFTSKARHFPSCIEASLFDDNAPLSVFNSLIEAIHAGLPTFYQYLAIRQRTMKLDHLDMFDLYVPLVENYELKVSYEEAVEWVIAALHPLGEEYCSIAKKALSFESGWVDVFENQGKRTGACSVPNYRDIPYICLNFDGTLDAVFTLAHELGHSMHTYYSDRAQPFRYSDYRIMVAEIASTFNECLLFHYLIDKARAEGNKQLELYLVNSRCDDYKGTIIRQTQFAEFEKVIHAMAENDEPITPDSLSKAYKDINDVYYGDTALASTTPRPHTLTADTRIGFEYLRIPHFFYNFYVYKYATSMSVSDVLAERVLRKEEGALERYFTLLKAGCSKDPLDIIADAGVDIRTPQPFIDAMTSFKGYVQQLDELLKE